MSEYYDAEEENRESASDYSSEVNIRIIALWMPLFSWVPNFVDWTKMTNLWGSQIMAIVFSFIIHTENRYFMGTRIHGSDPPWKPRKMVPHEN